MKKESYQGWANYETWLVALWLDNDEYIQQEVQNEVNRYDHLSEDKKFTWETEKSFREFVEDVLISDSDSLNGFTQDLVNSALSEVNYSELILHFQDDE